MGATNEKRQKQRNNSERIGKQNSVVIVQARNTVSERCNFIRRTPVPAAYKRWNVND